MQHGFWNIKVVKEELVPLEPVSGGKSINYKIVLTLDEGSVNYVNNVDIKGYPELLQQKPFVQFYQMKDQTLYHIGFTERLITIGHFI